VKQRGSSVLIVGSNGQDGLILQEILQGQRRQIYRSTRHGIVDPDGRPIDESKKDGYRYLICNFKIDEVYFLAAEHSPAQNETLETSQSQLQNQLNLISDSLLQLLELFRVYSPSTKLFFASSALVFGLPTSEPQDESTPRSPNEIYGLFKSLSQEILTFYRETYGLFAFSGILYPHESQYRKENFLFKKIVNAAVKSRNNPDYKLLIADTTFKREWNCAYQTMNSVIELMKLEQPRDFVIGSGIQHSVGDVVELAYAHYDLDYRQFIESSSAALIPRSSMLRANPNNLLASIGSAPDGDVGSLLSRTFSRL